MRKFVGRSSLALVLAVTAACAAAQIACSSSSSTGSTSSKPTTFTVDDYPKPAVANAVDKGDPLWEGQYYFLYDTWGGETTGAWSVDFLLEVLKEEPDFFGNQFEKFGFIPDPNDDLPIGLKRGSIDPTLATETCAPCHTGKLPDGTIWFGQPNLAIDIARLDYELNKRWTAKGNPSHLSAASEARALAFGPGRCRMESDSYPNPVPGNMPVHYDLDKRTRVSSVGGPLDARTDIYVAVGALIDYPLDDSAKVPFPSTDQVDAMVNFMVAHHPPAAPAQDPSLVATGKNVFHAAQCDTCHHPDDIGQDGVVTLDTTPNGIDRLPGADADHPRGSIHTDPSQYFMAFGNPNDSDAGSGGGIDPGSLVIIKFGYIHQLHVAITDGYVTPNLHGLWATAPYLNNGSVPTLQDLLNPASQRPTNFQVQGFTMDTTQPGNGNFGHEFGTDLSASDKTALIAYLNSL